MSKRDDKSTEPKSQLKEPNHTQQFLRYLAKAIAKRLRSRKP